jgi:MFS family permease
VSDRTLNGLNWLNFLVAVMQAAFGAFLTVYLAAQSWSGTDIGVALSVGTIASMLAQVPAGLLVDAMPDKKLAVGIAILATVAAALVISARPASVPVLTAEAMQSMAGCMLTPAIAAITLALTHQDVLGERLGRNMRFAAFGSLVAAALMGMVGDFLSQRAVFYLAAAGGVAGLAALRSIRAEDLKDAHLRTTHPAVLPPLLAKPRLATKRQLLCDRRLLIFAGGIALFQLGNAALLPLAAAEVTRAHGHVAELVVAAAIVLPQGLAAMVSPAFGRAAQRLGRRPILLAGFAAMPLRALLLATGGGSGLMILYQAVDAISAAAFGVMVPLVVADITHRGGRFNLAMGVIGLAVGIGATFSTTLGGALADRFGTPSAFLALSAVGVFAAAMMAWQLPETMDLPKQARPAPAPLSA